MYINKIYKFPIIIPVLLRRSISKHRCPNCGKMLQTVYLPKKMDEVYDKCRSRWKEECVAWSSLGPLHVSCPLLPTRLAHCWALVHCTCIFPQRKPRLSMQATSAHHVLCNLTAVHHHTPLLRLVERVKNFCVRSCPSSLLDIVALHSIALSLSLSLSCAFGRIKDRPPTPETCDEAT